MANCATAVELHKKKSREKKKHQKKHTKMYEILLRLSKTFLQLAGKFSANDMRYARQKPDAEQLQLELELKL